MGMKLSDIFELEFEETWNARVNYTVYQNKTPIAEYEKEQGDNTMLSHKIDDFANETVERIVVTRNGVYQVDIYL
ncbi:MAG: hypothetical protein MSA76_09850 [Clostridium sp.]|nr:hypothetical protein [Clostridium sp.]